MTKELILGRIRKYNLFKDLSDQELENLLENSQWIYCKQGQVIFESGEPAAYVYIVCYGATKLIQMMPTGEEVILHFVPSGGLIAGIVAMQPKGRYPLTAVALEDTGLIKLKSESFRQLVSTKDLLASRLLEMVSQRMADLHSEKMVNKSSVALRIADFLLRQLERQPPGTGSRITMRLTRQDIANSVGTSVETVIRILSQWTQKKIITTHDRHIEVLNKDALKNIS